MPNAVFLSRTVRHFRGRIIIKKLIKRLLITALLLGVVGCIGMAVVMEKFGVAPRTLAPYIEKRSSGHNPWIVRTGQLVGQTLQYLDRGPLLLPVPLPALTAGVQKKLPASGVASVTGNQSASPARVVMVASSEDAVAAIQRAQPGDRITFLPGLYRFNGARMSASQAGTADMPIVVRARDAGTVVLELEMVEGFTVSAPYWTFENLTIRGVCKDDSDCEHAFHVVGKAHHFTARNNLIEDFNAHFKINGERGDMPDAGLIEYNTLKNNRVRDTANPVVPIDLVAANGWKIRHNLIHDFIKGQGNMVSYGGFVKGAGSDNHFLQNMVFCEYMLRGHPGQRIGLSLGGGGTGKDFCRDRQCVSEQQDSSIQANLIAGCSDVGIYLNRAAASRVTQNTVIDTAGIDVRFPETSAELVGNLVDGAIRSRDGGSVNASDNSKSLVVQQYLGWHPIRSLFNGAEQLDYSWRNSGPPRQEIDLVPLDLCSPKRTVPAMRGAFDEFRSCMAP